MSLLTDLGNRLFKQQSKNTYTTGVKRLDKINLNKKLDYETSKIILNDPQVIIAYDTIKYLLSSKNWFINGDDTGKVEFIRGMFNDMNVSLNTVVKNCLTALLYGFSVQELIFNINNDGYIIVEDILPIHIKTLQYEPFIYHNGKIIAIHQEYNEETADIPINKCLKYTFNDKFNTNYGYGVLNDFKPIIEDKLNINQWEMNFIESFGAPTYYGKTDEHNKEYLLDALIDMSEGLNNIVLGETDEIGILETNKSTDIFLTSKQYKDNQIFKRLYLGNLLLGDTSQTGSYSQSQTQLEFGKLIFDGILEEIADTIQNQIIKPIIEANYKDATSIPYITFDKFSIGDYSKLLNDLKIYIDAGVIDSENPAIHKIIENYIELESQVQYENTLNEIPSEDYPPNNEDLNAQILGELNAINQETN